MYTPHTSLTHHMHTCTYLHHTNTHTHTKHYVNNTSHALHNPFLKVQATHSLIQSLLGRCQSKYRHSLSNSMNTNRRHHTKRQNRRHRTRRHNRRHHTRRQNRRHHTRRQNRRHHTRKQNRTPHTRRQNRQHYTGRQNRRHHTRRQNRRHHTRRHYHSAAQAKTQSHTHTARVSLESLGYQDGDIECGLRGSQNNVSSLLSSSLT